MARELASLSGPWTGYWVQMPARGGMSLTLRFQEGKIEGEGRDQIGPFKMTGGYSAQDQVQLTKRYRTHLVRYEGRWDGASIAGQWTIKKFGYVDRGEFEIWPLKDNESMTIRAEDLETPQTDETPQPVPALS